MHAGKYQSNTETTDNLLVLQAGCSAITNLCKQMPADAMCSQHESLLPSLLPNLSHQHSRVRASSLAALDTMVMKVWGCLGCPEAM